MSVIIVYKLLNMYFKVSKTENRFEKNNNPGGKQNNNKTHLSSSYTDAAHAVLMHGLRLNVVKLSLTSYYYEFIAFY